MAKIKQAIPAFCRGKEEALIAAISEGGRFYPLNRIIWCWISEGNRKGQLAMVTPSLIEGEDPIVEYMVGDNSEQVQVVETLPSEATAEINVLYIVNNAGYIYNGTDFIKLFDMTQMSDLEVSIDSLRTDFTDFTVTLSTWQEAAEQDISNLIDSVTALDNKTDEYEERIRANAAGIDGLTTRVDGIDIDITDIRSEISDIESRIQGLQEQDTEFAQSIETISSDLTALQNRVTTVENDVAELKDTLQNDYMDTPATNLAINQAVESAMELINF